MTSLLSLRPAAVVLAHMLIFAPYHSQDTSQNPVSGRKGASKDLSKQSTSPSQKLLVKDGTPIQLKLKRGVYSQYAKIGDEVDYLVDEEVLASGKIIVPEGAIVKEKSFRLNTNAGWAEEARSTFRQMQLGFSTVRVSRCVRSSTLVVAGKV